LTHADDLAANLAAFDRVLAGEIDGYSMDKRYIGKDGRIIYTTISVKCLRGPDGSIDYFLTLLQDVTQRKKAEEELKTREEELERKSFDLAEANTALKVLLRHREEDKWALENTIQANVRELVFPYIEKLRNTHLSDSQGTYLGIIESGLNEIISPFLRNMAATYSRFTRTEIQVANLIRSGASSKEIAELLNVSTGTVETHRNNIRNKLGLRHKDINLQAHLLSL
jgi:DNA-binding CsgD family transcriptional regulator